MTTERLLIGDCRERLAELPDASVDSVAVWTECLRVLKPGHGLPLFGGMP